MIQPLTNDSPHIKTLTSFVALGVTAASLNAQPAAGPSESTTTATPPPPSAGLVNDWLRSQESFFDPFDLGGQFRARYVYQTYFAVPGAGPTAVDFRANTPVSENDFLLLRTRFRGGYSPTDWFTVLAEGQNSSSTGDRRNPNLQSDGPVDLRQAYVRFGGTRDLPVSLKVGRQELDFLAVYQPTTYLQFQAGFSHFFTGDYVNQTFENLGGPKDANWAYLQAQLNF